MKKEFEYHPCFDINRVKNPEQKRIVCSALYYMQLTLTPLLYINYLRAINRTHYKVAMEILRAIDGYIMSDAVDFELPEVHTEAGQALLAAILYDIHHCNKTYRGGFIYGIIDEMNLDHKSAEYETLKVFIANYFNRVNDYVCTDR